MNPQELKRRFGDRIVFWGGGCDSQHVPPFAAQREVHDRVCANLKDLMPAGGYVFNNVHNIQAGVPAESIVALFDAAYECGHYR